MVQAAHFKGVFGMKAEVVKNNPFLTPKETGNLPFLAKGDSPRQISELRCRSIITVRRQIESAREKLGAKNVAHLIAIAIQKGILNISIWLLMVVSVPGIDDDQAARVSRTRLRPVRIRTVRRKD